MPFCVCVSVSTGGGNEGSDGERVGAGELVFGVARAVLGYLYVCWGWGWGGEIVRDRVIRLVCSICGMHVRVWMCVCVWMFS